MWWSSHGLFRKCAEPVGGFSTVWGLSGSRFFAFIGFPERSLIYTYEGLTVGGCLALGG